MEGVTWEAGEVDGSFRACGRDAEAFHDEALRPFLARRRGFS
jgi:hypothetical protein